MRTANRILPSAEDLQWLRKQTVSVVVSSVWASATGSSCGRQRDETSAFNGKDACRLSSLPDDTARRVHILDRDLVGRRDHQETLGCRNPIAAHANSNLIMNAGE